MTFKELVSPLGKALLSGPESGELLGIADDSREAGEGFVFIATRGTETDGHRFIPAALQRNSAAIVAERAPEAGEEKIPWAQVANTRDALGVLADRWHGKPSAGMKIAGITGTNGKTTTAFLLHGICVETLHRAGLSGTVLVDDGEERNPATHTTPGSLEMHGMLRGMSDNGCRAVVMEASSHGIEQGRISGVEFDVAVFTNLTQDHLDYHRTMSAYYRSKKKFFDVLSAQGGRKKPRAVINTDDEHGRRLARDLQGRVPVVGCGFGTQAGFRAGRVRMTPRGTEFGMRARNKSFLVRMPLIGRFNIHNALSALAAADAMGIPLRAAVKALENAPQVPGRMEQAGVLPENGAVFVDYAHTPDALENACRTLRELEPKRLITVFGCGGDRDSGKRPLMARTASEHSDLCIVTSDNPRTEDPESIIGQIEEGFPGKNYRCIPDRRSAIREAIALAAPSDIVLIAGKGHEDHQIIGKEEIRFDDRQEARRALRERV